MATDAIANLVRQLRAQGGSWDHEYDRAQELAGLLAANGITDLSQLRWKQLADRVDPAGEYSSDGGVVPIPERRTQQFALTAGDRQLGYLGNINRDGTYTTGGGNGWDPAVLQGAPDGFGEDAGLLGWSAQGRGNMSYVALPNPDGTVRIAPQWASSRGGTYDDIRGIAAVAAAALGAQYGLSDGGAATGGAENIAVSSLTPEQAAFLEWNAGAMAPGAGGWQGAATVGGSSVGGAGAANAGGGDVLGSWGNWQTDPSSVGNWARGAVGGGGGASSIPDWARIATGVLGAAAGASDAQDRQNTQTTTTTQQGTQNQSREPWAPAQDALRGMIGWGANIAGQRQQQPFSPQQQTAYNNIGGLLNSINQGAPGLLSGFGAAASGANNFDRSNPRRQLQGGTPFDLSNWGPGLLSFFPGSR